jgi:hypothetical protein
MLERALRSFEILAKAEAKFIAVKAMADWTRPHVND